jgi:predicted lipoprotein with Yx(FWY)xxD motif
VQIWPVDLTFVKDKKAGDMTGQGLDVAGGYWWIVVTPQA